MTEQFKGKKIFLLCSAPDPKINHEKVKDHTWVTVKGSGWAIDNIWNIDRIPDYTFMTGHHRHKFINGMYGTLDTKTLIHLIPTKALWGESMDYIDERLDDDNEVEMRKFYSSRGMEYDDFLMMSILDASEGFRRLIESNYFIKAGRYYGENVSIGVGLLCYLFLCGAEEVVVSGLHINKTTHSYSGRDLSEKQLLGAHLGEDMITLMLLKRFNYNIKTFEPELNRVIGIPMK